MKFKIKFNLFFRSDFWNDLIDIEEAVYNVRGCVGAVPNVRGRVEAVPDIRGHVKAMPNIRGRVEAVQSD